MSGRVLRGDVRRDGLRHWVVLGTRRGRAGEARTMVVLGWADHVGAIREQATRPLATVAGWERVGRGRLSRRDAGVAYYSPRWGALPG